MTMEELRTSLHSHSHCSLNGKDQGEKEQGLEVAKKEDQWVWYLRGLTSLVLLSVAVTVCLIVYFTGKGSEKANFEQEFSDLGERLVQSFEGTIKQRFGIVSSFADEITSEANGSWPFVTPANWHERAKTTSVLAQLMWTRLIPKVSREDLEAYDAYTWANQGWRTQGIAKQTGLSPEEINANSIWPTITNFHNPDGPTPAVELNPDGPYYPLWCVYPVANRTTAGMDLYGDIEHQGPIDIAMSTGKPVFEVSYDYLRGEEKDLRYKFMTQGEHIEYLDDPHVTAFFPGTS